MNPVVHFELPYKDGNRIAMFYKSVFGWKIQKLGEKMENYILATTAESDAKIGAPAGAINGGFFPFKPDWPAQFPSIVIAVEDIQIAMGEIGKAGGEVLGQPVEIKNFGQYVSFLDTEGNRISVIQPIPI